MWCVVAKEKDPQATRTNSAPAVQDGTTDTGGAGGGATGRGTGAGGRRGRGEDACKGRPQETAVLGEPDLLPAHAVEPLRNMGLLLVCVSILACASEVVTGALKAAPSLHTSNPEVTMDNPP